MFAKRTFHPERKGALNGLRILDMSRIVAGNVMTLMLADFGAEVIKIETLPKGDAFRNWQEAAHPLHWKEYCRNKKSVAINLRSAEGKEILLKLVETADGLVENFRPGRMEQIGLGPDVLLKRNPKLVITRLSGFGQTGPYKNFGGFGTLIEAMSGFAARNGFEDREPCLPPLALADNIAGLTGAMAVMMALYHRDVSGGPGQVIDLSLLEPLFSILGPDAARYKLVGKVRKRTGSGSDVVSPRNVYQTKDGKWVALSGSSPAMAARIFKVIGRADMNDDPKFKTNADRHRNRLEVDAIIGGFIKQHDLKDNLEFFRTNEVTVGPVYDITQIVEDPHFIEREILVNVEDKDLGEVPQHNVFPRMSETPGDFYRPAPTLGEHNEELLKQIGFTDDDLKKLSETGVIA
jgi:crotonobetainyl-CoA:carnitine CoA-transferase CaiB-like acyl-CoA transferase